MLYFLADHLEWASWFRIFRYVTFRTFGAAATAFFLCLVLGPWMIRALQRVRQPDRTRVAGQLNGVRRDKSGTPTMGGLLILLSVTVSTLLWIPCTNLLAMLALGVMLYMGAIGFCDDYLKVRKFGVAGISPRARMFFDVNRREERIVGLSPRAKLLLQALVAVAVILLLWSDETTRPLVNRLFVPFVKEPLITQLGWAGALALVMAVLLGSTNAVNLTDGLDGLAIGCSSSVAAAYLVMAYVAGHTRFAGYLLVPYVPGAGELAVFCGCLLGAGLGFLWYNCHPAQVFMGDTGSLALGGAVAMVAILIQQELTLVFVGGVFVMEAASVLLQTAWFKFTRRQYGEGRRLFRCAPLHHHFEIVWKEQAGREGRDLEVVETIVTIRFWIVSLIFALLGVATLKIR